MRLAEANSGKAGTPEFEVPACHSWLVTPALPFRQRAQKGARHRDDSLRHKLVTDAMDGSKMYRGQGVPFEFLSE